MKTTNDPIFIKEAIKTSSDMWFLGWCEANGGNISQRLEPDKMAGLPLAVKSDWTPARVSLPNLAGEKFMFSGTTRFLRNISIAPEKNLGVIEMDS